MPLTILKVSYAGNKQLNVHDQGDEGIPINRNQGIVVIVWELDPATLPTARFEELGDAPAFTWVKTPPPRVFSKPRVSPDGRRVLVEVNHVGDHTAGDWVYLLNAHEGDEVYSTTYTPNRALIHTTKNPVIINR